MLQSQLLVQKGVGLHVEYLPIPEYMDRMVLQKDVLLLQLWQ